MSPQDSPTPEEEAFDRAFAAKLAEFPVPAGLEAELLAIGKTATLEAVPEPRVADVIRPAAFRRYWPLAAAAAVALIAALGALIVPNPVAFPAVAGQVEASTFRDHMALFATSRFWLDGTTDDRAEAQAMLRTSGAPVFASVPAGLEPLGTMGCKSIDWNGRKVGLVCFTKANGDIVHLFTAEKTGFSESGFAGLGAAETVRGLHTAGWSDDQHVYLLVGSEPGIEVAGFLPAA